MAPFIYLNQMEAQKTAELFCSNNYNAENGVVLKWLYKFVYAPSGFDVHRKDENTSSWKKLNDAPIVFQKAIPAGVIMDKEAKELYNALKDTEYESLSAMLRAFSLIKAIYSEELATLFGIRYVDKTAVNGQNYTYKISLAGQEEALCDEKMILCNAYTKTESLKEVKLTRKKEHVDITWLPEIYRYYAVDVYRRSSNDSTFNKITEVPRAIQKDQTLEYTEETIFYVDTSISYEENYWYKFIAIDYFGQQSIFSKEFSVPAADFVLPLAPINVRPNASSVNQSVRINWELIDEPDLVGVNVYGSSLAEGPFEKINQAVVPKSTKYYEHTSASVGSHYYKVATIDQAGNENYSGLTYTEVKDITPPSAPTGLNNMAEEGKITLSWAPNNEADLMGYFVQRSLNDKDNSDNKYVNVNADPIVETTWVNELARNIKNKFVYRIIAVDSSFNRSLPSINSLAQMPDVIAPRVPQIKSVVADGEDLIIEWLANVDPDLAGYNLYRRLAKDSGNTVQVNVNLIPVSSNKYRDRRAEPGVEYEYMLNATDLTGNVSSFSGAYLAHIIKKEVLPSLKITEKKVHVKKKQLSLAWELSNMENLRGFVVFKEDHTGVMKPCTQLSERATLKQTLEEGLHHFQVRAYLLSGSTLSSEEISIELNSINN